MYSVGYSLNNAYICSENYSRSNGHLTAITLNTGDTIWTLRKQNARFRPIRVGTGKLERTFAYDDRGHATTRMATRAGGGTVQDLIDKCEFAQYAPELANGDMNAVLPEYAPSYKPVKWSDVLSASSQSLSYFYYQLRDSRATYAWGKFYDSYELRISTAGDDWIHRKKASSVAKFAKGLSWAGYGLGSISIVSNIYNTIDYIQENKLDSALICGVDVFVDGTSMLCGYYGLAVDILWQWRLKNAFWDYYFSEQSNNITSEY